MLIEKLLNRVRNFLQDRDSVRVYFGTVVLLLLTWCSGALMFPSAYAACKAQGNSAVWCLYTIEYQAFNHMSAG